MTPLSGAFEPAGVILSAEARTITNEKDLEEQE
jgi:hypothetical protein